MPKQKIVVYTFTNLPQHLGGRQTGGLAMVNWQASEGINVLDDEVEVVLSATDFHKEHTIGCTRVIGWVPSQLIKHALRNCRKGFGYGVQAVKLHFQFNQPILNTWAKLIFFDFCIGKIRPSILQLRGIMAALLATRLKGMNGIKQVLRLGGINGFDAAIPDYELYRTIEEYIAQQPYDAIFFNSGETKREWEGHYRRPNLRSFVIRNGYDQNVFHVDTRRADASAQESGTAENPLQLLTIASIQERKGQIRVVRALGRLPDKDRFHYICAGSGNSEEVEALRREAEINQIHLGLPGFLSQHDLAKLIRSAHYMILPSTSEGFGNAYIESIACGTPVIIPQHLPLALEPDVLNDKNAILIDGADEVSIAKCLAKLRVSSLSRREIAGTVVHLSRKQGALEYVRIFKEICQ